MKLNEMLRQYGREEAEETLGLPHYRAKLLYRELHQEKLNLLEIAAELQGLWEEYGQKKKDAQVAAGCEKLAGRKRA